MSNEHKVAVLMGGFSSERDISLKSGQAIWKALQRKNINAVPFDPKFRPLTQLIDEKITRVFIALHGTFGEDGHVQGILEYLKFLLRVQGWLLRRLQWIKYRLNVFLNRLD